jgi:hypothetical protein
MTPGFPAESGIQCSGLVSHSIYPTHGSISGKKRKPRNEKDAEVPMAKKIRYQGA